MKDESIKQPRPTKTGRGKLMFYFLDGSKFLFIMGVLFAVLMVVLELLQPQIIRYTVDTLLGDEASDLPVFVTGWIDRLPGGSDFLKENLWIVATLVIVVAAFGVLCRYLFMVLNAKASEKLVKRMRDTVFTHMEKLPFSWHMQNKTGDLIQRCTSDIDLVKMFLSNELVSLFRIALMLVISLIFMFSMQPLLTGISLAFMPVILGVSFRFHFKVKKYFLSCDENEALLSQIAQENLTGVRVVRAFGREEYERVRFDTQNRHYANMLTEMYRRFSRHWSLSDVISGIQILSVMVVGVILCIGENASLTSGEFIAFMSYNAMMIWPIRQLGRLLSEMSKASVAIDRLGDIMTAEEETDIPDAKKPPMTGDIVLDHVSFGFDDGEDVLHDVSLRIRGGSTLGILGGTGAGKSTLVALLNRLYTLSDEQGCISIGGVPINTIDLHWLRSHVGMVLQEPFLFSRSIRENIAISHPDIQEDDVRHAASVACLDETILRFSEGYETYVGERGVTLSGGQKQRCAIARLLVQKTPIMIFDDSLSAVDTETDSQIRVALREEMQDATVILIAHRITTVMHADHIVLLDKGKIVEEGNHEDLLKRNGLYRRIYDIQTGMGKEEHS